MSEQEPNVPLTPPSPAVAPPLQNDRPHKEPSDTEEVYYEGSPPARGLGGSFLLWVIVGLLLIAAPFLYHKASGVWPPTIVWVVCVVIGLVLPVIPIVMVRTIRYRISNYRIDFERGFFSKDIDTLELWHVEDLHFHQSLIDRMLGVGTIQVISHDRTMPDLVIRGIPHPRPLYETLKQRVIAVKRSRGVLKMDPG